MGRGESEELSDPLSAGAGSRRSGDAEGPARRRAHSTPAAAHPDRNEDAFYRSEDGRVAAVFDGIGGGGGGDRISSAAARALAERTEAAPPPDDAELYDLAVWMVGAFEAAHSAGLSERSSPGQGATVALALRVSESEALIRSAGDSRVYAYSPDGGLRRLTIDDESAAPSGPEDPRLAQELDEASAPEDLSEEQLRQFWHRNIISSDLLSTDPSAWPFTVSVDPGESLILTTDGIHDNLTRSEIEEALAADLSAERLIGLARERADSEEFRSKDDDITCVII